MNIPQLIKAAIGKSCTFASFVKGVDGNTKLSTYILTEDGKKKELRFNLNKPVVEFTEQDVKDLLHVIFKQIYTKSWNKEAEEVFQK